MHNPPMIFRRGLVLVAAAAALIGCGSADDTRPPRWSFISATIIEPSCATVNCHSKIANRAGVDLHDRDTGYNNLISRNFVLPGDQTGSSALLYLMHGEGSLRMPPDAPLPEADIALIERWIAGCQVPCND
jgi:cytochrome c